MPFSYRRSYTGSVQAVVLDWAGTTVDYGSCAPVEAFMELFRSRGVTLTESQVREPMGLSKRDHIREILEQKSVREHWRSANSRSSTEEDMDAMYREFLALQSESAGSRSGLIPGVADTIAICRERGLGIGSCSGYSREIMERILPEASKQGYEPDTLVCPEDVPAGRPYPWMMYRSAMELDVYPMSACVKVGDTVADVEEGLNAGAWTVGLARSGNELGLSEAEAAELQTAELSARLEKIYQRMRRTGAHYVLDTLAELPPVLDSIDARLAAGEQP